MKLQRYKRNIATVTIAILPPSHQVKEKLSSSKRATLVLHSREMLCITCKRWQYLYKKAQSYRKDNKAKEILLMTDNTCKICTTSMT